MILSKHVIMCFHCSKLFILCVAKSALSIQRSAYVFSDVLWICHYNFLWLLLSNAFAIDYVSECCFLMICNQKLLQVWFCVGLKPNVLLKIKTFFETNFCWGCLREALGACVNHNGPWLSVFQVYWVLLVRDNNFNAWNEP